MREVWDDRNESIDFLIERLRGLGEGLGTPVDAVVGRDELSRPPMLLCRCWTVCRTGQAFHLRQHARPPDGGDRETLSDCSVLDRRAGSCRVRRCGDYWGRLEGKWRRTGRRLSCGRQPVDDLQGRGDFGVRSGVFSAMKILGPVFGGKPRLGVTPSRFFWTAGIFLITSNDLLARVIHWRGKEESVGPCHPAKVCRCPVGERKAWESHDDGDEVEGVVRKSTESVSGRMFGRKPVGGCSGKMERSGSTFARGLCRRRPCVPGVCHPRQEDRRTSVGAWW